MNESSELCKILLNTSLWTRLSIIDENTHEWNLAVAHTASAWNAGGILIEFDSFEHRADGLGGEAAIAKSADGIAPAGLLTAPQRDSSSGIPSKTLSRFSRPVNNAPAAPSSNPMEFAVIFLKSFFYLRDSNPRSNSSRSLKPTP